MTMSDKSQIATLKRALRAEYDAAKARGDDHNAKRLIWMGRQINNLVAKHSVQGS